MLFKDEEPFEIDTGFASMTDDQIETRGHHLIMPTLNGIKKIHQEVLSRTRDELPYVPPARIANLTGQMRGAAIREYLSTPVPKQQQLIKAGEADISRRGRVGIPASCKLLGYMDKARWLRAVYQWLGVLGLDAESFLISSNNPADSMLDARNEAWLTNSLGKMTSDTALA
ncbi:hypothetical protein TrRE_jg1848, partial [Triparma retinervis]